MELSRILIRELNDYQIIELREVPEEGPGEGPDANDAINGNDTDDENERRTFPIVIGLPEAQAIERRLKGIQVKRPQTHDLLANLIRELGGELESITINDLADQTFFASLDIRREDGELLTVDSRPSDAIALGIASGVPIYVAEHVLESATDELT
ncbi:bifunctional nuclease family protein [Roseiflexus sp. AH-315-K22]|nr:bifunctional nuclease family protein [Roseiflexus sp. AH-315-K22]